MKYKPIILWVLFFSFILQILALVSLLLCKLLWIKYSFIIASHIGRFNFWVNYCSVDRDIERLREYIYHHTVNRIDMTLGLKLVNHLLRLPIPFKKQANRRNCHPSKRTRNHS